MEKQGLKIAGAVCAIVLAIIVLVVVWKGQATPEPTVTNLPDYSKMNPDQIAQEREKSMEMERTRGQQ